MVTAEEGFRSRRMFAADRGGCIHRPHGRMAATASIPSRYVTVVIKQEEKKGFNSGTQRFDCQQMNEAPGPGKYSTSQSIGTDNNVSFSKKGLGSFASKSKRFPIQMNPDLVIGPGRYHTDLKGRHDFNKANCTGIFHKPIVTKSNVKPTPAPNSYNICDDVTGKAKPGVKAVAHPPFLSRSKRGRPTPKSANPAPNTYDIVNKDNPRAAQAPFKSTSKRIPAISNTSNPGPGSYNPHEVVKVKKQGMPRKHYLCFAAPAMSLEPTEPPPGPGQYDIVDYEWPPKEYIGSSMFLSSTGRWASRGRTDSNPGPGTYNPRRMSTTFLYNGDNKWI